MFHDCSALESMKILPIFTYSSDLLLELCCFSFALPIVCLEINLMFTNTEKTCVMLIQSFIRSFIPYRFGICSPIDTSSALKLLPQQLHYHLISCPRNICRIPLLLFKKSGHRALLIHLILKCLYLN